MWLQIKHMCVIIIHSFCPFQIYNKIAQEKPPLKRLKTALAYMKHVGYECASICDVLVFTWSRKHKQKRDYMKTMGFKISQRLSFNEKLLFSDAVYVDMQIGPRE